MTDHNDIEPTHATSPTEHVLSELQLFGYRPFDDQPDPRPLPEGRMITGAVEEIDGRPEQIREVRFEPGVIQCGYQCVEDVGNGARDHLAFR